MNNKTYYLVPCALEQYNSNDANDYAALVRIDQGDMESIRKMANALQGINDDPTPMEYVRIKAPNSFIAVYLLEDILNAQEDGHLKGVPKIDEDAFVYTYAVIELTEANVKKFENHLESLNAGDLSCTYYLVTDSVNWFTDSDNLINANGSEFCVTAKHSHFVL